MRTLPVEDSPMKRFSFVIIHTVLAWLVTTSAALAQFPIPGLIQPDNPKPGERFSGHVIDCLGRPIPNVKITCLASQNGTEVRLYKEWRTDKDGHYEGRIPADVEGDWLNFEKAGYMSLSTGPDEDGTIELPKLFEWNNAVFLTLNDGEKLVSGVRELLASEEWSSGDKKLIDFVFENQEHFRPAFRQLIKDPHIGKVAFDWLEILGEPSDTDLFPFGRQYSPGQYVKEVDLIEALKATARQRHFNSGAKEPFISIDLMSFTETLDRAFIKCGINRGPMTGITWQFVYRKVGKEWVLWSAVKVGIS